MRRTPVVLWSALALTCGAFVQCYAATEIVLDVRTDVEPCGRTTRASLFLGDDSEPRADTEECTLLGPGPEKSMGTLVLVPGGSREARIVVRAALSTDARYAPRTCTAAAEDRLPAELKEKRSDILSTCAFASRSVGYAAHRSLRVPIRLLRACLGIVCAKNETCVAGGRCASNDTVCEGDTCETIDEEEKPVNDGGAEGGADGGPFAKCSGPDGNNLLAVAGSGPNIFAANEKRLYWSEPDNGIRSVQKSGALDFRIEYPGGSIVALAASGPDAWAVTEIAGVQKLQRFDGAPSPPEVQTLPAALAQMTAVKGGVVYMTLLDGEFIEYVGVPVKAFRPYTPASLVARGVVATATSLFIAEDLNVRLWERADLAGEKSPIPPANARVFTATDDFAWGATQPPGGSTADPTIYELLPSNGRSRATSLGFVRSLAVDNASVYAAGGRKGNRLHALERTSRNFSPGPLPVPSVYAEPGLDTIEFVDVDLVSGPDQCVYFWAISPTGDPARLRIVRKGAFGNGAAQQDAGAPAPMPYDRGTQQRRVQRAEKDMALLGRVNPLALEEFAALEERYRFLSTQLEDLKNTRRDLLTVVREVDDKILEVFTAAYHDVAREFEIVFATLFPGGDGRLVLTDPDDMLTTGIEVEARPPGKKVKRLSLLSGGERSLTAMALLVAIFRARPSPFYVLDEIEAALDDVNLRRLISLLEELREASQLIVITHQKPTMEVADALYGVSMRGDGITTVISQRLRAAS